MSTLMRTRMRNRPKQSRYQAPMFESAYNQAYEDGKKGIVPNSVAQAYRRRHVQTAVKKIEPFTMSSISNIRQFTRQESRKLFKASLLSRASVYDNLRASYQQ